MEPFFSYPYARPEGLGDGWVTAVYLVDGATCEDVMRRAGNFAVGQSVGTWVKVPGISEEMVTHRQGRVVGLELVPAAAPEAAPLFILRLAFPTVNFGGSLAMLLTALVGNDASTALPVRLLDIVYPNPAADGFRGPRQGIDALRALAGVPEKRPLVLNMIKPCAGFSPREGAALFREVATGGVDLIKDDELLGSPTYNQVSERTKLYLEAARAAAEHTGKRPVYFPNITAPPRRMRDNAKAILEAGAKACLVNYVFGGLDALKELSDEFGDDLFIMGHYAGVAVFDGRSGIANSVMLGMLPRLAGAHTVMTMPPRAGNAAAAYDFHKTVQAQTLPHPVLAPVLTTVGGGITPVNQQNIQQALGPDIVIGIGGAIQGHPAGTAEGARAAMAAVKATAAGHPLRQAAQSCPPLEQALALWDEA